MYEDVQVTAIRRVRASQLDKVVKVRKRANAAGRIAIAEAGTPEEFGDFCAWLALNPDAGDVVSGTGGCRKVRWSMSVVASVAACG